jgi:hypothetical protein
MMRSLFEQERNIRVAVSRPHQERALFSND